jgi:hypothetical protein
MKKIYNYTKSLPLTSVLTAFCIAALFTTPNIQNNFFEFAIVLSLAIASAIISVVSMTTGRLELENGVLSRISLLVKVWSVPVSELSILAQGVVPGRGPSGGGGGKFGLFPGITFINKDSKIYRVPYTVPKQEELAQDLLSLNPQIKYYNFNDTDNYAGMLTFKRLNSDAFPPMNYGKIIPLLLGCEVIGLIISLIISKFFLG